MPNTSANDPFLPFYPKIEQMATSSLFDETIRLYGSRIGWSKAHSCPCSAPTGNPISGCQTCSGRGIYWSSPALEFTGNITYGHTAVSSDDPGECIDMNSGLFKKGEPTLTIPQNGNSNENSVWNNSGPLDAFSLLDTLERENSLGVVGVSNVIPYECSPQIIGVIVYNSDQSVSVVSPSDYSLVNGAIVLSGYPEGTRYTVEYSANPVFIAFRRGGGAGHSRPFGGSQFSALPRSFRLQRFDVWLRSRFAGDGPTTQAKITPVVSGGNRMW